MASLADLAPLELLKRALDPSRLVDLTHPLTEGIPSIPTHPKFSMNAWPSYDDPAELNRLVLSDHSGTHVDASAHFVPGGDDPRRVTIDRASLNAFIGRAALLHFGRSNRPGSRSPQRRSATGSLQRSFLDVDSGPVRRPTLSHLGASRAGETHRAEWAYDHLNVLDAPHPWTVHRDRGAVAWRFNPQPAPRDHRGGATRRSRDRWRLLRLDLFRLLRVAPQRAANRAALRPWAEIPRLRSARRAASRNRLPRSRDR